MNLGLGISGAGSRLYGLGWRVYGSGVKVQGPRREQGVRGREDAVAANVAHIQQPRPDSSLRFQVNVRGIFSVVPSSLVSGRARPWKESIQRYHPDPLALRARSCLRAKGFEFGVSGFGLRV